MGTFLGSRPVGAVKVATTSADAPAAMVTKVEEKTTDASPSTRGTSRLTWFPF